MLERYHRDRDRATRDDVIARLLPVARYYARRYQIRGEPLEDLEQVASLALVKAVDRFDPDRGVPFLSFAIPTIVGDLKRHFRDACWSVHVPRELKTLAVRVESVTEELAAELGRSPSIAEIAERANSTVENVLEALDAACARHPMPLDGPSDAQDELPGLERLIGVEEEGYAHAEDAASLTPLISTLAPREREIVRLRFDYDLSQTEIAARIGISQMHVSRLLRRSIARMRELASQDIAVNPPDHDADRWDGSSVESCRASATRGSRRARPSARLSRRR